MAFDVRNIYFLSKLDDCAKYLTQEELDVLQGLIKKVDINCPQPEGYFVVSKGETPKLFSTVQNLYEEFYLQKD